MELFYIVQIAGFIHKKISREIAPKYMLIQSNKWKGQCEIFRSARKCGKMKKEKESGEKVVTFGGKLRIAKTDRELWQ